MALSAAFISKATSCIGHASSFSASAIMPWIAWRNSRPIYHRITPAAITAVSTVLTAPMMAALICTSRLALCLPKTSSAGFAADKENRIMIETDGDLLQTSARIYVGLLSFA